MKPVHVCVPVIRRYDLLACMLDSLRHSLVKPEMVYIIDNGRDAMRLRRATAMSSIPYQVYVPLVPMGVAESWNWFLENVPEERVITNDDVRFMPGSIGALISSKCDLVWAANEGFSCFVMRNACVQKVGLFDETISPGYGYYEDEDYLQRLDGRGMKPRKATAENVECGIQHARSSSLKNYPELMAEHHRKFKIAQQNYIKKWHLDPAAFQ